MKLLKKFRRSEDGAVTVDWVVLTAAMAGFGLAIAAVVTTAATDPSDGVGAALTNYSIE